MVICGKEVRDDEGEKRGKDRSEGGRERGKVCARERTKKNTIQLDNKFIS